MGDRQGEGFVGQEVGGCGALVIELGCEKTNLAAFTRHLGGGVGPAHKPVIQIGVQQMGGTGGTVREGLKRIAELLPLANETSTC